MGSDEDALLAAIRATPRDVMARQVYADWLEDRGDRRAEHVRAHLALHAVPPDHPARWAREAELGRTRRGLAPEWIAVIEPEPVDPRRACSCFEPVDDPDEDAPPIFRALELHGDVQDTECDAWKELVELIEDAAARGETELAPFREIDVANIVTLPPSIGKVRSLRRLNLYGSRLRRLPRELGQLPELVELTPYTSYWLHWFPYELARCPNLRSSTVSTRALYGNFKHRPPFPALAPRDEPLPVRPCSVCDAPFEDRQLHRVWISLRVATDVLPLLVNACSRACLDRLPPPAEGYVATPHRGGPDLDQPDPRY